VTRRTSLWAEGDGARAFTARVLPPRAAGALDARPQRRATAARVVEAHRSFGHGARSPDERALRRTARTDAWIVPCAAVPVAARGTGVRQARKTATAPLWVVARSGQRARTAFAEPVGGRALSCVCPATARCRRDRPAPERDHARSAHGDRGASTVRVAAVFTRGEESSGSAVNLGQAWSHSVRGYRGGADRRSGIRGRVRPCRRIAARVDNGNTGPALTARCRCRTLDPAVPAVIRVCQLRLSCQACGQVARLADARNGARRAPTGAAQANRPRWADDVYEVAFASGGFISGGAGARQAAACHTHAASAPIGRTGSACDCGCRRSPPPRHSSPTR